MVFVLLVSGFRVSGILKETAFEHCMELQITHNMSRTAYTNMSRFESYLRRRMGYCRFYLSPDRKICTKQMLEFGEINIRLRRIRRNSANHSERRSLLYAILDL